MAVPVPEGLRLVAFQDMDQARTAIDAVTKTDLQHMVGPQLSYEIPKQYDNESETWNGVMEASAFDIVALGIGRFVLDVCTFSEPATLLVTTSYSIELQSDDMAFVIDNLNGLLGIRDVDGEQT